MGVSTTEAPSIMSVVTRRGSMRVTARLARRMNAAQQAAAKSANIRPSRPTEPLGRARSATPSAAQTTQTMSSNLREPATATDKGPKNSTATTIPTGARLMAS